MLRHSGPGASIKASKIDFDFEGNSKATELPHLHVQGTTSNGQVWRCQI